MPVGLIFGISVAMSGRYRPQLWLAWVTLTVAGALMSTLKADTTIGHVIGYQIMSGFGLGILMTVCFFPVLAPLHVSLNASALAFFMFVRYLSQVCFCIRNSLQLLLTDYYYRSGESLLAVRSFRTNFKRDFPQASCKSSPLARPLLIPLSLSSGRSKNRSAVAFEWHSPTA